VGHQRRDISAGLFHVYTHSVWEARALFRDDVDRTGFLRHLARVTIDVDWTCLGFCLMNTHHHLIVEVGDGVLPVGMHSLNLGYARDFNKRHRLRGHAQFRRYGSTRIRTDEHLLTVFRYVMRNPVDAGLCTTPQEWLWSSYAGTVGLLEPHSFVDATRVLDCFAGSPERRTAQLRAFVEGM
jgi:REP element-mobilizing transposase RayT